MNSQITSEELREINPESGIDTLGAGFAFPLRITDSGGTKITTGEENVKSCIYHIAAYRKQELYGTPSFGSNLPALLFSVFTLNNLSLYEQWMQEAIENYEKRASEVRITAGKAIDNTTDTKVVMLIQYGIDITNTSGYINYEIEE